MLLFLGWVDVDLSDTGKKEIQHAARLLLERGFNNNNKNNNYNYYIIINNYNNNHNNNIYTFKFYSIFQEFSDQSPL